MMGSGAGGGVSGFDRWWFIRDEGRRYLDRMAHSGPKDKMYYKRWVR